MGVKYLVDIEMAVSGDPAAAAVGKVGGLADGLGQRMGKVGTAFADGFTGAVEAVGSKLATLGKVGVGAGIAAATYGVLGLNNELEATTVSLAAVLNANEMSNGMADGMKQAAGWVLQMKKDAKDLPGEFSDLLGIVQSGAGAAFNAGLDVKGFERMASQGMAAAKAMAVPMDQAGRELAQLLEGRAGGHNVFGTRLGIHAQGFNERSADERLKILQDAMAKFEPAIKTFGDTFDAQSSTLIDNAKTFLGAATGPLFNRVKDELANLNEWFDANQGEVMDWAHTVGDFLVDGFNRGKSIILEYGPVLLEFIGHARDRFLEIWESAEPLIGKIGSHLFAFLANPESIDKLITLGKLYAAVKVGGAIGGFAGGAVPGAGAVGGAIQAGAFGYMAGAATGVDGLEVVGAGAAGGAKLGGEIGGPQGAVLGGLIGAVAGEFVTLNNEIGNYLDVQTANYQHLLEYDKSTHDAYGRIDTSSKGFADAVDAMTEQATVLDRVFGDVGTQMEIAALKINNAAAKAEQDAKAKSFNDTMIQKITMGLAVDAMKGNIGAAVNGSLAKKKKTAEGKGGVSIGNVTITVSSNQSPGQIARDVMAEMVNTKRYRTSSPRTSNFAAGR